MISLRYPVLAIILLLLAGCSSLPSLEARSVSTAFTDTESTRICRAVTPLAARHPGMSGVHPLLDSLDAFAARMLLARAADRSLDVQYYIWHDDLSGRLLLQELHEAAARGVRVRLLLDDNGIAGLDVTLAALDAHPNIEERLFNPFPSRTLRWTGYLTDFSRLNRRMHNKSFTADNQASIVGGRNVGDEYFDAAEGSVFVDLDVLAVGPVVREVSRDFDGYWASGSAYPVDRLVPPAEGPLQIAADEEKAKVFVDAVRQSDFVLQLMERRLPFEWGRALLVSDDPAKGLGDAAESALLPHKLGELLGEPRAEVELISAYFVPGESTGLFTSMAKRGVRLTVLTNSFEATDVAVVHAGYAKRRKELLEAGVTLYELKRISPQSQSARSFVGSSGSSASSLHAKTFSVDRARVFVGSFNFDPRSANLNTEMGILIDSAALAQRIASSFETGIPERSYEVRLSDEGELYWIERRGQERVRHDTEPGTSFWQRAGVRFMSLLPIDWLL
jgi:putative cardiolipin synthase